MTVNTSTFLAQTFKQVQGMGDKSIASDAMFVIDGFEQLRLLTKQFPWPILSPGGSIEMPGPNGQTILQPQQLKTHFESQIVFTETLQGDVENFSKAVAAMGGVFDATVYEGTMERYKRAVKVVKAFIAFDPADRDWDNKAQATIYNGTISYHYFGETIPGNF